MSMEVLPDDAGASLEKMKRFSKDKEERGVGAEAKGRREEDGRTPAGGRGTGGGNGTEESGNNSGIK